jgi:hypothetical protein
MFLSCIALPDYIVPIIFSCIKLSIYIVPIIFLQRYLKDHPPEAGKTFVPFIFRPFYVLFWMAVPLLGPLTALWWIKVSPLPILLSFTLFIVLPLFLIFLPWLWWTKVQGTRFLVIILALLLALLLPLIGVWLMEQSHWTMVWRPTLIPLLYFILAPPVFALFLLYFLAPKLLPLPPGERKRHRRQVAQLLTGFFTGFPKPAIVVREGKMQTRIGGSPFTGTGPGLIITEPENAVMLRGSSDIKRVVGPGVIFTGRGEVAFSIMDLQRQFHVTKGVEALTQDGIRIRVPCSSIFQIRGADQPLQPGQPWPYRKSAAITAFLAAEVNPQGKSPLEAHKVRSWIDPPLQLAIHRLKQVIAKYSLDELFAIRGRLPDKLPRIAIAGTVRELVKREMAAISINVIGGGVGNRIVPLDEEVIKQRIDSWKATQMRKIMINKGKAEAEYLKQLEEVRGNALEKLVNSLKQQSIMLQTAGPDTSMLLITLWLLETLEGIARDPHIEPLLPESTQSVLATLRRRTLESSEGS